MKGWLRVREAGWEGAEEQNCEVVPTQGSPLGMTLGKQGPPRHLLLARGSRPDSRVTGLGDECAQLLDPVVNVESPATFNLGGRGNQSGKESSTGQGGKKRNWDMVGKLLQGGDPQGRLGQRARQGCTACWQGHALTHLDCDCPSSAVPSKGPWPLSLEESRGSQGLWAQERWRAARAAEVGFGGHRQGN